MLNILTNKNIIYRQNVCLKKYNTFRIKSVAEHFYLIKSVDALIELKAYFENNNIDYLVLGHGSNVLFANRYIQKPIIYTGLLNNIQIEGESIVAQSGVYLPKLIALSHHNSLTGLEFLSSLPASVGGATYMNARCYGSEMSQIIESVGIIDDKNEYRQIDISECLFAYKRSIFQDNKYIIVDVKFKLSKSKDKTELKQKMLSHKYDRIRKRQFVYPSAGCVFLNDYNTNMIAGKVIDEANMRGTRSGGAMVLNTHANFIVNYNHASGADVLSLIDKVRQKVLVKSNIELKNEVRIIR